MRSALAAGALLAAALTPVASHRAAAVSDIAYLGQVVLVANTYCPPNAVPADGRLLGVAENSALFQLLENRYGGKYADHTFALPDLGGRAPAGMLYCLVVQGPWPSKN